MEGQLRVPRQSSEEPQSPKASDLFKEYEVNLPNLGFWSSFKEKNVAKPKARKENRYLKKLLLLLSIDQPP